MNTQTVQMKPAICYLFNVIVCSEKMENTCSTDCQEVIQLSFEEQKELRKGKGNSNKIFKKGRSKVLKFKN